MKKQIISASLLTLGFLIGATALSALAVGTWTDPECAPPGCNVDAPVNVGTAIQTKLGKLAIGGVWDTLWGTQPNLYSSTAYITSLGIENLVVATGTRGLGKVLVDTTGTGVVGWGTSSGQTHTGYVDWKLKYFKPYTSGNISIESTCIGSTGTGNCLQKTMKNQCGTQQCSGVSESPFAVVTCTNGESQIERVTSVLYNDNEAASTLFDPYAITYVKRTYCVPTP